MNVFFRIVLCTVISLSAGNLWAQTESDTATSRQAALERVTDGIKFLASDELAGRMPGTVGIEKAAQYIEKAYKEAGLKPLEDGTYRQEFIVRRGRDLDREQVSLTLMGPDSKATGLVLDEDFIPQIGRGSVDEDAELVFVGYGIVAEDHNYDEYKNVDVKDKIVVMIRREPQQNDADSVFDGTEVSSHAYIAAKVRSARDAGAAGIIMVNDNVTADTPEKDTLSAPDEFGASVARLPFFHVKRSVIDGLLKKSPLVKADGSKLSSLKAVEDSIDESLEPLSQPIKGSSAKLKAAFKDKEIKTSNIVGIIEGEGPNADETIVIGGHYDHLGMGGFGSRSGGRIEIHNGADDNATGTEAVVELARMFAKRGKAPGRRLVFVCFSAEEMGLLGAQHYVKEPLFPLENTVAMVNFDMIGWLRDDKLTVFNWNSCAEFDPILTNANQKMNLDLVKPPSGFAGSDHLPFFQKQIPVMFMHTGLTSTYHTPEDDFETLDCDGALKVIEFTEGVIDGIAELEAKPQFVGQQTARRIRLGVSLNSDHEKGVEITRVSEDSIAAKAGLKEGDVIMAIDGKKTEDRRAVNGAVRSNTGKKVKFKILRGTEEMTKEIELKN
ncbi:MAG: M28 family peptidase [Mariniblastus sp.]|nr:M28 family peptidase [Mariniblastus sp.]